MHNTGLHITFFQGSTAPTGVVAHAHETHVESKFCIKIGSRVKKLWTEMRAKVVALNLALVSSCGGSTEVTSNGRAAGRFRRKSGSGPNSVDSLS